MFKSRVTKLRSGGAWMVLATLTLTSLGPVTPANAASDLTVQMGNTLKFTVAHALSAENFSEYANDCSALGYSMQVTALDNPEVLFERTRTFETEHCLNKPSHWQKVFVWDKTQCTVEAMSCVLMPNDKTIAGAGQYAITFRLDLGGENYTQIENTFSVQVLPSYFYMFSEYSSKIFPHVDGYMDHAEGYLQFWNESGEILNNFPSAKVGLKQGTKVLATDMVGDDGFFSLKPKKAPKGKLEIVMLTIPNPAGGRKWVSVSATPTVSTAETKISGLNLDAPGQVFPEKDNYLDKAVISVSSNLKGSQVVKTFPIAKSGAKSVTWDGKTNGKIVPGTYTIVATAAGPTGGTMKKSATIKVSPQKMVYKTLSKTYTAYVAADESQGDSYAPISRWGSDGAARFYSSGDPDLMLVKLSVPTHSSTVKWRIKFNNWSTTSGFMLYRPCKTANCLESALSNNTLAFNEWDEGSTWTPWAAIPGKTANFSIASLEWGSIVVDSFTVEYVTRVLK
jgi:hypothetical protein